MQQAVDSAQVHERTVVGDVLHVPAYDLAFAERVHQRRALGVQSFFENDAPAHHHVAAPAVQLGDAHLDFRAEQFVQVLRGLQVVLRTRQERAHTDVHHQPALNAVHHLAGYGFFRLERRVDLFPSPPTQDFLVGNDLVTVLNLARALHFDRGVRIRPRNFRLGEFCRGNQPFRFAAEIDHHAVLGVGNHLDLEHLVRSRRFLLLVELLHQLAHLFGAGSLFLGRGGFFGTPSFRGGKLAGRFGSIRCRRCLLRQRYFGRHCRRGSQIRGRPVCRFSLFGYRRSSFLRCAGFAVARCGCGGSRDVRRVLVVRKHGCWPPEDTSDVTAARAAPHFSHKFLAESLLGSSAR